MAILVNEQQMVDNNVFRYEEKIKSPTSRFLDTTPTFTTYYHIDNADTTLDEGFVDVASVIGHRSPLRFSKIENFPLYGIEQIVLQLQDDEHGLDSTYEGDGIILPSTIKPVQNDFFIIPILKDSYVFRVTDIQYDNLMPDNFYKIGFKLEYIDDIKLKELDSQKNSEYTCVLENIGTESNCIIEKSSLREIREIEKMYIEMADFYTSMFYDDRHNVFLCDIDGYKQLYDPLQTEFINKHRLFNERNNLECMILTDEYTDPKRKLKYNKSVYRLIELRDLKLLSQFKYVTFPGITLQESSFSRWHDKKVEILDIPQVLPLDTRHIFSDEFVTIIKMNGETSSNYADLICRYIRNEDLKLKDISMDLNTELIYLNDNIEVFFFTPIIMYIIKDIIKKEIKK